MQKQKLNIIPFLIPYLLLIGCGGDICSDDDNREFFNSFENNLKIDPGSFSLVSEIDTVEFNVSIDFDEFTTRSCILCLCGPTEFENFDANLGNGSFLILSKDGFSMLFFLFLNNERNTQFQIREENGEYNIIDTSTGEVLTESKIEVLPEFEFKGQEYNNVVRLEIKNNGLAIEELIYQRQIGILTYRNFIENYQYDQIGLE